MRLHLKIDPQIKEGFIWAVEHSRFKSLNQAMTYLVRQFIAETKKQKKGTRQPPTKTTPVNI